MTKVSWTLNYLILFLNSIVCAIICLRKVVESLMRVGNNYRVPCKNLYKSLLRWIKFKLLIKFETLRFNAVSRQGTCWNQWRTTATHSHSFELMRLWVTRFVVLCVPFRLIFTVKFPQTESSSRPNTLKLEGDFNNFSFPSTNFRNVEMNGNRKWSELNSKFLLFLNSATSSMAVFF